MWWPCSYDCEFDLEICNKTFDNLIDLKKHIESDHYGLSHKCNYCEKSCNSVKDLKSHINKKHNNTIDSIDLDKSNYEESSSYSKNTLELFQESMKYSYELDEELKPKLNEDVNSLKLFQKSLKKSCEISEKLISELNESVSSSELFQESNEKVNSGESSKKLKPNENVNITPFELCFVKTEIKEEPIDNYEAPELSIEKKYSTDTLEIFQKSLKNSKNSKSSYSCELCGFLPKVQFIYYDIYYFFGIYRIWMKDPVMLT